MGHASVDRSRNMDVKFQAAGRSETYASSCFNVSLLLQHCQRTPNNKKQNIYQHVLQIDANEAPAQALQNELQNGVMLIFL